MSDNTKGKEYTRIGVFDIDGVFRGKLINPKKLKNIQTKGFGFCNVIFAWDINDQCYSSLDSSKYVDENAQLDLDSLRQIPWQHNRPFYIADFSKNTEGISRACPRSLLKRMLQKAENMSLYPFLGFDFEWFNFLENPTDLAAKDYINPTPISPGMFGYSTYRMNTYADYINDLLNNLNAFGIPVEGIHTETGNGVYEAAIEAQQGLKAVDNAALFKTTVKEIANNNGLIASFMAKWNAALPGCSGHIHQSLWNKDFSQNLFSKNGEMSEVAASYLAGQLHCLPYLMPMYAPTVNSYKRFIKGSWAATTVSWGIENRTTAIRLIPGTDDSAFRMEFRVPGADANPYLSVAAAIASGLYGIEKKLKLTVPPTPETEYINSKNRSIPTNLGDAIKLMEASDIAEQLFGKTFTNHFIMTRKWEWEQYNKAVTNWELKRYFELT